MEMDRGIRLENGYNERADKFWSIYVDKAKQYDSSSTETWKGDMESTLIFAGLFSATVISFIIESYKLLKPNPTDITNVLLSRLLAAQTTVAITDSTLPQISDLPTTSFTLTTSAVSVNILWFLSLSCSLGTALCITLVQSWVRDYLQRIQCHNEPLRRARIRAFLFDGTQNWKMDIIIESIPTLLHAALFLFFAGLIIFLSEYSVPVSLVVATVTLIWLAVYIFATVAPVVDAAAPYETMLTGLCWSLLQRCRRLFYYISSHSQYKPSIPLAENIAAVRTYQALNPELSDDVSSPDAQAFMWARNMITNDQELESFLESIPGFLSSEDGRTTWAAVYSNSDTSYSLQRQIIQLLATCARATYMESGIRRQRASTCIESLYAISQYEILHIPAKGTGPYTILDLSRHVRTMLATRDQERMPITKGICTLTLLVRQHFISISTTFNHSIPENRRSVQDTRSIPKDVVMLSSRADEALREVNIMRQMLEEGLQRYTQHPQNHQKDIIHLLRRYFSILGPKSQDLLDWGRAVGPIIYEYGTAQQHPLLSWYSLLPDIHLSLAYNNISGMDAIEGGLELYALQVLAFMRRVGVYPQLPDMSRDFLTSGPLGYPHTPFQIQQGHTDAKEFEYLCRELEPLSRLLNLLDSSSTTRQVEIRSELLTRVFIYQVPYPEGCPILTDLIGPFSTIAFILEDIQHSGARIVALLDLMMKFKTFAPKPVESHVIREMIDTIFPEAYSELKAGSQVLFVAVLRAILDWERDRSPTIYPCPFSDSDIMFFLKHLKKLSYKFSLETAERLFGLSPTDSSPSISCAEENVAAGSGKPMLKPPQNTNTTIRIQGVYNHVLAQRTKFKPRSA